MPITSPPAERAPRDAASITPLIPPQTRTAPASPIRRPTSSASGPSSSSRVPLPITATCGGLLISRLRGMSSESAHRIQVAALVIPHARLIEREGAGQTRPLPVCWASLVYPTRQVTLASTTRAVASLLRNVNTHELSEPRRILVTWTRPLVGV